MKNYMKVKITKKSRQICREETGAQIFFWESTKEGNAFSKTPLTKNFGKCPEKCLYSRKIFVSEFPFHKIVRLHSKVCYRTKNSRNCCVESSEKFPETCF